MFKLGRLRGRSDFMEIDIEEESVTVEIPERDFRMKLSGSLPDGSMKWVVLVILAIFLGAENVGLLNMP